MREECCTTGKDTEQKITKRRNVDVILPWEDIQGQNLLMQI